MEKDNQMNVVVDKKMSKTEIETLLKKIETPAKQFDAKKYFGKAKIEGDLLRIQQEMRDE